MLFVVLKHRPHVASGMDYAKDFDEIRSKPVDNPEGWNGEKQHRSACKVLPRPSLIWEIADEGKRFCQLAIELAHHTQTEFRTRMPKKCHYIAQGVLRELVSHPTFRAR